jgi:predicted acyl esterase
VRSGGATCRVAPPSTPRVHHCSRTAACPAPPGSPAVGFTYDPADPTSTIGGQLLTADAGVIDDRALAARADVATFTGAPLPDDLDVADLHRTSTTTWSAASSRRSTSRR